MARRYRDDPHWRTARFESKCAGCGAPILKGNEMFWYPLTKQGYGKECRCGEGCARDFEAARFDEDVMGG